MRHSRPALPALLLLAFACGRERAPARAATAADSATAPAAATASAHAGDAAIYVSNEDSRDLTVIDAATDSDVFLASSSRSWHPTSVPATWS